MHASHRGTEQLWQSSPSRRTGPTLGQDVPSGREIFARAFAGWMLLALGWLVLANTAIASAGPEVTGSDWSFALLAASTTTVTGWDIAVPVDHWCHVRAAGGALDDSAWEGDHVTHREES